MKTNHIILQWLHLIFMCRTAPWNICGCTALLLLSIPPPLYLFSSLSFPIFDINEFEASILSPGCPSLISPLTLPLVHSHQPEAGGSPGPHPSYCHPCIPCLSCSPCQLDSSSPWCHPVVLTNYTIGRSPSHALNLVSFVLNFQLACTVCLLLIMYNARALRCNSKQGELHNHALKELPGLSPVHLAHDSPCVWKDHCTSTHPFLHVHICPYFKV